MRFGREIHSRAAVLFVVTSAAPLHSVPSCAILNSAIHSAVQVERRRRACAGGARRRPVIGRQWGLKGVARPQSNRWPRASKGSRRASSTAAVIRRNTVDQLSQSPLGGRQVDARSPSVTRALLLVDRQPPMDKEQAREGGGGEPSTVNSGNSRCGWDVRDTSAHAEMRLGNIGALQSEKHI